MAPLVLAQILRYGQYIKKLVVIAKSVRDRITSEEQLVRIAAGLSACENLQSFGMRGVQCRVVGQEGSLAAVLQTLATRASQLEYLRLDPYWTVLRGMDHLAGVLQAAIHLKRLEIECTGGQARNPHARQLLPLPPLPVLTELRIPTADLITAETFAGTNACKKLQLAHVRPGDLAHLAQCVGHSLECLDISSLAETYHQNPPPVLAALRQLKLPHNAVPVRLSPLLDPATPLETLTIYELNRENLDDLQEFYNQQPHKTLTCINIISSGVADWLNYNWARETEELAELVNCRLRVLEAKAVLERCCVWGNRHGIKVSAKW